MKRILAVIFFSFIIYPGLHPADAEVASDYTYIPPFLTNSMPPMVMLTMARDHRLYYEAYNDASDINGDGFLDIRYNPKIDYYGYFDSYKYYEFDEIDDRFEPRGLTTDKKAPNGDYWSGDFLNYVSMTRMDCLRKVLYGGYRYIDTPSETVLERAYIPQDAHSFGKEYNNIAIDGYDIREYTPLDLPIQGFRHLIATTALGNNGKPLLRVLPNSTAKIWEWVSSEAPVVKTNFGGSTAHPGHPQTHEEFETMVATYAVEQRKFGSNTASTIDGQGNPFGNDDNYLTIFTGNLTIGTTGDYWFAVDGDDAVEVVINGQVVAGYYGAHGKCSCTTHYGQISLTAGTHSIEFRHEEGDGGDNYYLYWKRPGDSKYSIVPAYTSKWKTTYGLQNLIRTTYNLTTTAEITDYTLRIQVGTNTFPESNCKIYPNKTHKPIGILQRHGESDLMHFGLLTGSYTKNLSGGVLRQTMGSIRREINETTGEFLYKDNSTVGGIIKTVDSLRIHGYPNDGTFNYNENCGWITTHALNEGECRMWGNPLAEMIYETTRYFTGAGSPTPEFVYSKSDSALDDNQLGLPLATWNNPYNSTNYCAKPIMVAISDIFPSYDSNQLPGSAWANENGGLSTTLPGMNVNTGAQNIANMEGVNGSVFIGQNGDNYTGSCTPKDIPGFEGIRGLCPEEPSKQGSYYSAPVTHYAATKDLSSVESNQTMASYMVALSSPLPEIRIPVGNNIITMVPFAKSVGGSAGGQTISSVTGDFQPTNTIVDFFVEEITPTTGTFRVNFEDVEQGADHDQDAIARYSYEVQNNSTVKITVDSSLYASGSIMQHMGYIISGTNNEDGTYLVVRDKDTSEDSDPDYHLDTPNNSDPLPLISTREFSPGNTSGASLLKNPLWYAAKWGGFEDINNNGIPDLQSEWDKNHDGEPDTYFYVANPTRLEEQLNKAFGDILRRTASGTAVSVVSQSREGEGAIYQSIFFPEKRDDSGATLNWAGQVQALFIDSRGNIREDTNSNQKLDTDDTTTDAATNSNDKIITYNDSLIFRYHDLDGDLNLSSSELNATAEILTGPQDINFLWSSTSWINNISDDDIVAQRTFYNSTTDNRYIRTFADKNNNMIVDNGELQDFAWPPSPAPNVTLSNTTDFYSYLTLYPSFEDTPSDIATLRSNNATGFASLITELAKRQVDFIRGADQEGETISEYSLNATRSRKYTENGNLRTWRLGDIVYSTPTVIGRPSENYDLLYEDDSYTDFFKKYKNRRQVVYVGANDGMLHAFNGGFFKSTEKSFCTSLFGESSFPLGAELWAFIPYNLLPHLLWLTDQQYGKQLHVSYMDLKPRAFDARIFFQSDGITPLDEDHPNGWGTVLVAGMRLGGGEIRADLDKTDSSGFDPTIDRKMSSAYVIIDITNPEKEPRVLGEVRLPGLGFTTCYPTAMPMTTKNAEEEQDNKWYLVFGSGPADASGKADPNKLNIETSDQQGHLYVLDLKKLAIEKKIVTLNSSGTFIDGNATFALTEPGSFISDPIAVDLDLGSTNATAQFKANVIYYGTIAGDQTSGMGTIRRLITDDSMPDSSGATSWIGNSTLLNTKKPVTAASSVAMDDTGRLWVYSGTGRFFNRDDIPQENTMTFYGIKEPANFSTGTWTYTWETVSSDDLYNSTDIVISNSNCTENLFTSECVQVSKSGVVLSGGWESLLSDIDEKSGWLVDMPSSWDRVLNQPTVLGGAVMFTSYLPSTDLCAFEGTSKFWALYYKTGTAFYDPIFSGATDIFSTYINLGKGVATSPSVHSGDNGMTTVVGTSPGGFRQIEPNLPIKGMKSGTLFWLKRSDE